jgi:hypothetical protein
MADNKYTPKTIDKKFIIPLYQRLFEWEDAQVLQLLNDLYSSYKKAPENPYYIGMLTAFKANGEERYSLVDGQQRFTVLTLIGIVFGWKEFLKVDGKLRLSFFARKNDEKYLNILIEKSSSEYENRKMKAGIECIRKFIKGKEVENFQKYVFEQTTFFVSELPNSYTLQDLNRYFETMNEAGKGLENHEILKVMLLKEVASRNYDQYTTIWNAVSEMDKCIVKQKENEKQEEYKRRNVDIFKETMFEKVFNGIKDNSAKTIQSLKNIEPTNKKPSDVILERNERAILTFTDFLMQVLWICLTKEKRNNATDFFNRNKLLETFEIHIKSYGNNGTVDIDTFFNNLLNFRVLFDYYVIRLNSSDERNVTYSLNQVTEESNNESKRSLIQYQSMLYVSTESHLWLTEFLEELANKKEVTTDSALAFLQEWDNKRQNLDISLNYGSISRYWFWRLDYYLWIKRDEHFKEKEANEIAGKYIFRSNRSIEHIAPQNPKTESEVKIYEDLLHKFGNLAMISAGQNSSLQNESFELKKAYVQSFINKSVGGSIQSLKMLKIYEAKTWDDKEIKKNHNEMIQILIESFKSDDNKYDEVIKALEGQIIKTEQKPKLAQ